MTWAFKQFHKLVNLNKELLMENQKLKEWGDVEKRNREHNAKMIRELDRKFWEKRCPACDGSGCHYVEFDLFSCPVCAGKGNIAKWRRVSHEP